MLYYVLISIVFIAELVIALTIVMHLVKWGRLFRRINNIVVESKESILSIVITGRKISEQLLKLSPIFVENIKGVILNFVLSNIKTTLIGVLIWGVRQKIKKYE